MPAKRFQLFSALILAAIVIAALLLRLFRLDSAPTGVTVDEASYGYIAYSLLHTARDEHSQFLPLVFTAYGDQKLPLQAYLTVPSVAAFGLSNFATRLPSALAGTLLVLLIYFLARAFRFRQLTSLFLAFFVAISPWSFFLSRFAYESNLALCCFLLGLLGLIHFFRSAKPFPAAIFVLGFALSWHSYIAYRPLIIAFALFGAFFICKLYRAHSRASRTSLRLFLISLTCLTLLIVPSFLWGSSANLARFQQIGFTNDPGAALSVNENREFCLTHGGNRLLCYALYNKFAYFLTNFLNSYVTAFSPEFLFLHGETDAYLNFHTGQFPLLLLPFLLFGFFALFHPSARPASPLTALLIFGLLLAPLPASLAGGLQKVRLSPLLPFLLLLIGLGLNATLAFYHRLPLTHKRLALAASTLPLVLFLFFRFQFFATFYTVYPYRDDLHFQSHLRPLSHFLAASNPHAAPVFFRGLHADILMYYSYYTALSPQLYQATAQYATPETSGFAHATSVANLHVTEMSLPSLLENHPELTSGFYITTDPTDYAAILTHPEIPFIVFTATSSNGVHQLAYVVDIAAYRAASASNLSML